MPVFVLLLTLPVSRLTAQAVRSPNPHAWQSDADSSPPWLAWQVVARNQVSPPQNEQNPNPSATAGAVIANDGLKPLTQVTLDIRPVPGEVPPDIAAAKFAQAGQIPQPMGACRPWVPLVYWWQSPAFCHRPLYFEEVNLERYGYTCRVPQPLVSAAHFFGTVPAMPYLMAVDNPCECIYSLGHHVPGSRAPYQTHYPPLSLKGGLSEAAVVTGLIVLLP
jgi:hypothetical protein